MKIGPYRLPNPVALAPMAGVTDKPFRQLCRELGAGYVVTEMLSSNPQLRHSRKSTLRSDFDGEASPVAVQIAGSDPAWMAEAARYNVDLGAQIIDINMGCPAKKVCNKLAGSALLKDTDLVSRILDAVVNAVQVPVTLKIRSGWDRNHRNGVEVARIAEASGIAAITIHGRTRACRFKGAAEYETVAQIKKEISIPVIANGDIFTPEKSLEVLRLSSADGLMIGRGAQGRPWIFRELNHFLETGRRAPPLDNNEVRDTMLDHLDDLYKFYGETTGVRVARKHLTWYCAGVVNSKEFRSRVVRVESASEQIRLTHEFFRRQAEGTSLAA